VRRTQQIVRRPLVDRARTLRDRVSLGLARVSMFHARERSVFSTTILSVAAESGVANDLENRAVMSARSTSCMTTKSLSLEVHHPWRVIDHQETCMKKMTKKQLELKTETIRNLTSPELSRAAGGTGISSICGSNNGCQPGTAPSRPCFN
jgi:hypothetical protein